MWRPLIIAGALPAGGAYCHHAQESPRPARPSLLSSPPSRLGYAQHGDYPNGSDAVRYLGNGGPACSGAPECRPLSERRPSLTPRVWSPENHLDHPTTTATAIRLENICRYLSATTTSRKLSGP